MSLIDISNKIILYFQNIPLQYLHSFGYLFVFLSAIIEALPFFGTIFPGQTIIIISGFLAYQNLMNLYTLLILTSIGAIIGDLISFYLGEKYGFNFIEKYGKYILINKKRNNYIKKLLNENLGKAIFIGRFNSATRAFMPFIAGSIKINYFKFMIYNILTGILWSSTWVLVGYFAGVSFEIVVKYLSYSILIATILSILIWILFKYLKDKKHIFTKYEIPIVLINIFSIYIFSKMIDDVINNEFMLKLDFLISNSISNIYNPLLNNFFIIITNFAGPIFIIIFSFFLTYYLFKKKKFNKIYFYLTSIIVSSFLIEIIKNVIQRLRPQNPLIILNSFSYPSGHTTISTVISLSLFFIFKNKIKNKTKYKLFIFGLILYPLLIGFSRIYLNVHYLSDIIGGFALGTIVVTSIFLIRKYLIKK